MINIFDRTLKIIARNHADIFLKLAFPQHHVQLVGTVDNVEISLPVKPVDFVHHVIFDGEPYLFHLEFQLQHKDYLPQRTFITSAELTEQFNIPVLTVFLYVRPRKKAIPRQYTTRLGDEVINQFSYPVIKLWDYVAAIRQGHYRALAPLLVLLVPNPDEALLQEEKSLILTEPNQQKQADLLAAAIAVASRYFMKDFLWQFFSEEVEQMKSATFIDDWITEGIEKGIQQGMQQGIQQGMQQGIQQGMQQGIQQGKQEKQLQIYRDNIMDILIARFELISQDAITQIKAKLEELDDQTVLQIFLRQAATTESIAKFEALLPRQ